MTWFKDKTKILERDDAKVTIKLYNGLAKKLIFYEILFHDAWVKQCSSVYDALEAPILTLRGNIRQELVLNFDPFFRQVIDETEIIRKMELEVPDVAQIVYFKQDKLFATYEQIKGLLDRFLMVKSKIPNDLMVLIRPLVKKVEKSFMPGISSINWTSFKCDEYFQFISAHLDELEIMVEKVDDIVTIRINQCLFDISHTMMIDFPEDRPMPIHEYMDKIRHYGAVVSKDLEYKSRACESAVIELINTLLATCDLNVPDEILFGWMNPAILGKESECLVI
jgi:dynein heavy chain